MKSSRFPRYNTEEENLKKIEPEQPFRPVPREELRFTTAELNYGMGHSAHGQMQHIKAEIFE